MMPFGPLRPDGPPQQAGLLRANNVLPRPASYAPLRALEALSEPLAGQARGMFAAGAEAVTTFAGTPDALYQLRGARWRQVGGPYPRTVEENWSFAQFGDLVIATNGSVVPQKWQLGISSAFLPLGGSPPPARCIATVRDFVVLGNIPSRPTAIKWSGIDAAETWNISQDTQADEQTLPDGGEVLGLVGGEYGVILQSNAIRRMSYVGTPFVFQIDKVEDNRGVLAPGSIAGFGPGSIYYLSSDGFYVTDGNGPSRPIGAGKIDRTFLDELDPLNLHQVSACIDAVNKLYVVSYPNRAAREGIANRLAIHNLETGEWSFADISCQRLFSALSQSTGIDDLPALGYDDLDAMVIGLDSRVWQGGAVSLAAVDPAGCLAGFTGATLEAVLETGELAPFAMSRAEVTGCLVLGDGGTPAVAIAGRAGSRAQLDFGAEASVNRSGIASLRRGGRALAVRVRMPAGSEWGQLQGFELQLTQGGRP